MIRAIIKYLDCLRTLIFFGRKVRSSYKKRTSLDYFVRCKGVKRGVLLSATAQLVAGCFVSRGSIHLSEAEEQLRQKEYDKAIASYRAHIDDRLAIKERQEWENPNFYLMLIVDIELQRNNIKGAEIALQEAQQKGVDQTLVADRWRSLGSWYEKKGDLKGAFNILQAHRELDPLLFDSSLDRIAKKIVESEEKKSDEMESKAKVDQK